MPRKCFFLKVVMMCMMAGAGTVALAEPTAIEVRVLSKGAKFIGTSMGGAEIVIRDCATGEILARGKTEGTTGDTAKIMTEPSLPHAPISTKDAASFRGDIDIVEPRQVQVTARGPLAQPQAINTTSVTQWIVPGKPVTGGDALLLTLPGFVVDVLDPPAHMTLSQATRSLTLRANVCMMCGCPITPEGLWDANRFEVAAIIIRNGNPRDRVPLEYTGETSQFQADISIEQPGTYQATVFAYDPENGNTGVDKTTFIVTD